MSVQTTPYAQRLHIAIYGRRNAGKSTLINMLCDQEVSLISAVPGTTTDPVHKAMEVHGMGPVVFYDTAGFDDEGELGQLRIEKTKSILSKSDIAIVVFHEHDTQMELAWIEELKQQKTPTICIYNQYTETDMVYIPFMKKIIPTLLCLDVSDCTQRAHIIEALIRILPSNEAMPSITEHLIHEHDVVLLVMPQDEQAPKGRLILPQVQTIRELLDRNVSIVCCTPTSYEASLASLKQAPHVIITDSQSFKDVFKKKPKESLLTSFSVLFARYKGDSAYFVEGAKTISSLTSTARILIAEACTHAPIEEDIGRVKLPRLLRKTLGEHIQIDMVNGMDFPSDVSHYDLIIHCGACMFHRTYVLSRVKCAKQQGIPMSNYGIVLAYLQGILDDVEV